MNGTKRKILFALNVLVVLGGIAFLIYYLFYAEEVNTGRISKCVAVLMSYLLAMTGIKKRQSPFDYKVYEEEYKDIINGAFAEDKRSYRKLLDATVYFNRDQYKKAQKALDKLLKKCMCSRDYVVVHMFKALCFEDEKKIAQAIAEYERVVQYDMSHSQAWSNLGLLYMEQGRKNEAFNAYSHAVLYDSKNPFAYNNLAVYYVRAGEARPALENALQALELDSRMYQAMGSAAIAYKMLGDEANVEKYCKMYGINGGDTKNLKSVLASI